MKRMIALMLVLCLALALVGCGASGGQSPSGSQQSSQAEPDTNGIQTIKLGEPTELDFTRICFSDAALTYSVTGSGTLVTAQSGMRLFCLIGTIENTGNVPMKVETIAGEMVFNGQYTYTARAHLLNSKQIPASLAPLAKDDYWICAEIPENLIDQMETCLVRFSLNKEFATFPVSAQDGDYLFELSLDQAACQQALEKAATATVFFDECPILPTPESYCPVYKTGSSSSSLNGKVSSITYSYAQAPGRNDDLKELCQTYMENLKKEGFTLQNETATGCDIYASGTKLATVSVTGSSMRFDIVPGNEGLEPPKAGESAETVPEAEALKLGDSIQTDYCAMTLDSQGSGMEIQSGTGQYGNYTYYTSDNGDPYLYLCGTFQNLGSGPVDIRHIYVQFCFDGTYNYTGDIDGVSTGNSQFVHDVAPLSKVDYVMYAAIPQELLDSFATCQVKIGFTKDFSIKVTSSGLPKFDYCDDVFLVDLKA